MIVEPWESRLAKMDHSKGTSDKMRKQAMQAEIKELRRLARNHEALIIKARASANQAQAKTREWRSVATRYQKELAQLRTQLKEKP